MTTTIRAELERSKKCCDTMGEALGGKTSPPGERSPILMGYWSLTYHHHNGIICLLHNELPAPAFALLRPIVEAALRAHVAIMGTDQDIEKLRKDTYKTNLNTIGPEIDTRFKMADALTSFL